MGFFDKIRLGSALKAVGRACKWAHDGIVSGVKKTNPIIRMYYDSELGSPIEGHVEKAFAASTCDALKKHCPNWKWAKNTCNVAGNWIAHKVTQALDSSKVIYQVSNGMITGDRAYHEIAKRATAGLFVVGKVLCRAGHVIGTLTGKISERILPEGVNKLVQKGVDIAVGETLRFIRRKVFSDSNKERVTKFVEKGMKVAVTATNKIINTIDTAIDKTQKAVKSTVEFISDFATKVGEELKPFKEKVKETAKNIGKTIVKTGKKIWSWLTGK
jgi:hypothetical protein